MKKIMKTALLVGATMFCANIVFADAAADWSKHCASCHGKDGSGATTMGKKLGVKDYTKEQSFSDAEAATVIKDGKDKMKGFKDKLSDADIKALVAYVRGLKK